MLFFRLPGGSTGTVGKKQFASFCENYFGLGSYVQRPYNNYDWDSGSIDHKLRAFLFAFVLKFYIPLRLHCFKIRQILEDLGS